jgi:DUF438 domain-containing protein
MQLSASTKLNDLLSTHPFLEDFLVGYNPHFKLLRNKLTRATVGRVATLGAAARIASVDLDELLQALAGAIEKETRTRPEVADGEVGLTRQQRVAMLGHIIAGLHAGGDLATARAEFAAAVGDVDAGEIAAMEEELIRGGLPVTEVQRLCDVHVGAFRDALDRKQELAPPPGHPVHTYLADNRILASLANRLTEVARRLSGGSEQASELLPLAAAALARYDGLHNHYQRKENQLFPLLERHGVTGPSQVMWGVHDQIRAQWKAAREAADNGDLPALVDRAPVLGRSLVEMIYKEEKILFPMAMEKLTAEEWAEEKRGEDELGYRLAKPAVAIKPSSLRLAGGLALAPALEATDLPHPTAPAAGLLPLGTGALALEMVDLLLRHLPIDISFVDEHDVVRYYAESKERVFPRTPAAIGRTVQNCHPPKSVHMVNQILAAFRAGTQEVAEFWINLHGRFIHIRYFAVRDASRAYRGCLEVVQDVTHIRRLDGERRLLDWKD